MNLTLKNMKHNHLHLLHEDLFYKDRCPECGSQELITDAENGEIICFKCGLVLKNKTFTQNPEWRAYTPEDKRQLTRVGLPLTLTMHDMGLQTTFYTDRDPHGKILPKNKRVKMMRLKKWQKVSSRDKTHDQNLKRAMSELKLISDKLNLPKYIQREAALIYRKALKMRMIRGRAIVDVVAASIHLACRINRMPRGLSEIVTASERNGKRIARYYRKMAEKFDMKIPPDEPAKYIAKIANVAKIDPKIQNRAMELLHKARGHITLGKKPSGLAAALLYIACVENGNLKRTQMELAEVAGVTEVTIRTRVRSLMKEPKIKLIRSNRQRRNIRGEG